MIFTLTCHKIHCHIWNCNVVSLKQPPWPFINKLKILLIRVFTYQADWTFVSQFSKILMHFPDKSGEVCHLAHSVTSLKIIAGQNDFYQNLCLEETFPAIWYKTYLHIWNFKVGPHYHSKEASRLSIFTLIAFIKALNAYFFTFWSKMHF